MSTNTDKSSSMSRRAFIKGAAVSAAAVAGAGALATPALAESLSQSTPPAKWDYECDVLVSGSGNGGMSAFLAACDGGAKALLIEVSSVTGGSTLFSGSNLHTEERRTWEDYNAYTLGQHDQVLAKVLVETFWNEYIPWLTSKNAYFTKVPNFDSTRNGVGLKGGGDFKLGKGEPDKLCNRLYFDSLVKAATALGGTVMTKTRAVKLYTDDAGAVIGLQAQVWSNSPLEPNQKTITIKAKKTILATGNFYGNKELLTKFVGANADRMIAYGGPYQTGDGIIMAKQVGAALSGNLDYWGGGVNALVAKKTPAAAEWEKKLAELTPDKYGTLQSIGCTKSPFVQEGALATSIFVNLNGKRFTDESSQLISDMRRAQYTVLFQEQGAVWVVGDKDGFDADPLAAGRLKTIIADGGRVKTANSLEELAGMLETEGMYKANLLRTIAEYNQEIDAGTIGTAASKLEIPRTGQKKYAKILKPPFYAIPIMSYTYFNMGGLAINQDAQTLDLRQMPIANLYTPPPLGGGVMRAIYTGGIACAGVFGYRAGKHAAASLKR